MRVARRIAYEQERREDVYESTSARRRVLLLGAGQAGVLAAREIQGRGDLDIEIHGFVDDDPRKQGALIHGVPVLGTSSDLPKLVAENRIQDIVITIAQISRREILRMMEICRKIGVNVRIIPGLYEILQGNVRVTRIRDVEIEDLLGRERVYLEEDELARFVAGKRVVVTGAGGSIGSELARQVARFGPSSLILLERAEFVLFDIDKELRRLHPELRIVPVVADVGDEPWIRTVFATHNPQVVFHAAAHKHVPMMESNPSEAIKNNIIGTRVIAEVAANTGVEAFVMISTDKAVRPTSVMGASKRVAELIVQDLARRSSTRFVAVRFGNVMGSAGSVIPIFREQIQRGGPVTVTDPEMKRYFMTIPEAAQLVMQAGAMGRGGEIFILDMGHPVRILDLAVAMINLSGLRPFEDIEIAFTGLRPGEKLFEELELDGEGISKTRHPKIFIGLIAPYPEGVVDQALVELQRLARTGDSIAIREYLNDFLPEATLARARKPELAAPEPAPELTASAPERPASALRRERKTNPPEPEAAISPLR
jgi:FlaA1/EpsC-like NDP-sugar epimerase